jgi:uncharacterized protein involved in outer membrane biogenesis
MKKLFKWLFRLFLVLFLLLALLILFLDPIAKSLAERQIRRLTGLEVVIGRLSVGLLHPTLSVQNFKLFNSDDFGGSTFIDIPALQVEYDLQAIRLKKIHLNLVRLNLGELHVVQNKDGKTNLQALQDRQKSQSPSPAFGGAKAEFDGIDTFKLTIGRLKFTSDKNSARNEEAYVGVKNETLKNVKSAQDLQPLAARIALEKNLKFLTENVFSQGTSALLNATNAAGNSPQTGPTGPNKKN